MAVAVAALRVCALEASTSGRPNELKLLRLLAPSDRSSPGDLAWDLESRHK